MLFRKRGKARAASADRLQFLVHKPVKYVSARGEDGIETVLGKAGFINLREGRVIVCCGNETVLDKPFAELEIGELLSKNGATFTYTGDDGRKTTVVAYYSYYRKT